MSLKKSQLYVHSPPVYNNKIKMIKQKPKNGCVCEEARMGAEQLIDLISPTSLTSQEARGTSRTQRHSRPLVVTWPSPSTKTYATGVYLFLHLLAESFSRWRYFVLSFISIFQKGISHTTSSLSTPPRSVVSRHFFFFVFA